MIAFLENRHGNFAKMKIFVPLLIEIADGLANCFRLKKRKTGYFLHRDIEEVDPRFSSKVYP
jgi:hypothetical protein